MSLRAAFLPLLFATSALAAGPFESEWSVSRESRARLIADATGAGLEIALAPGAITYWRNPGDAGVPPTFDFSGSENLASAEVVFPAPERIPESDGSVAFGYRGGVVLPIKATPADPGKPIRLSARVDYAVCEKICVPARANGEIELGQGGVSPFAAALAQARTQAPVKVEASALGVTVSVGSAKSWRLCLREPPRDLFVEAPEGFWLEPKREADRRCFTLTLQQAPDGAKPPIALRLTVEGDAGAEETKVALGG